MVLKRVLTAAACTTLLLWSGLCLADQYRPDEFLGMDLSKAALSPKRLGPPEAFGAVPARAKAGHGARTLEPVEPRVTSSISIARTRVAERSAEGPHGVARGKPARHHTNPLDAQASDTRIQVWPCRSGGICNWKR